MQIDIKTVNRKISVRLRQIVCLSGMAEYIYYLDGNQQSRNTENIAEHWKEYLLH